MDKNDLIFGMKKDICLNVVIAVALVGIVIVIYFCLQKKETMVNVNGQPLLENLTLYDVLVLYMNENYSQAMPKRTLQNIKFQDKDGRQISLELKWKQGHKQINGEPNGELVIKEISIEPRGEDVMTKAVAHLVSNPNVQLWGLNKVVLTCISDQHLFEELQSEGWSRNNISSNNLYFYKPDNLNVPVREIRG